MSSVWRVRPRMWIPTKDVKTHSGFAVLIHHVRQSSLQRKLADDRETQQILLSYLISTSERKRTKNHPSIHPSSFPCSLLLSSQASHPSSTNSTTFFHSTRSTTTTDLRTVEIYGMAVVGKLNSDARDPEFLVGAFQNHDVINCN
jgi:hypothetical protein